MTDRTAQFEQERSRLTALAARVLSDPDEAQDVVQQAWLRLDRHQTPLDNVAAWLTTVTTRLCLDRLKARVPAPLDPAAMTDSVVAQDDPAYALELAHTVGAALNAVLERLTPPERVAFVMHDSFGFDFALISAALDISPAAARKLASRARAKVRQPVPEDELARWEVVDAFMAAARGSDFDRLLALLAPEAIVSADEDAAAAGTPARIEGRRNIAEFFNGAAHAALPVLIDERPGAAWFHKGKAMVLFDFDIAGGLVLGITFRAEPDVLSRVTKRGRP